jgi:hypothetical protein
MWKKFAPQGIAVKSRCGVLKAALDAMPARTMIGHVRYSLHHEGYNILRFVTTKRPEFAHEREVRALVWQMEHSPRNPYPHAIPQGLTYPIDLRALVNEVIVSPDAPATLFDEVQELLRNHGYCTVPVSKSGFTGHGHLLPSLDDIARFS